VEVREIRAGGEFLVPPGGLRGEQRSFLGAVLPGYACGGWQGLLGKRKRSKEKKLKTAQGILKGINWEAHSFRREC